MNSMSFALLAILASPFLVTPVTAGAASSEIPGLAAADRIPVPAARMVFPPRTDGRALPVPESGAVVCEENYKFPCSAGDFNGSGSVTASDISLWLTVFFSGPPYPPAYDLSGNGGVDPFDLSLLLCIIWAGC